MRKVAAFVLGVLMVVTVFASFILAADPTVFVRSKSFSTEYQGSSLAVKATACAQRAPGVTRAYCQVRLYTNNGSPCIGPTKSLTTNLSFCYSGWAAYSSSNSYSANVFASKTSANGPWADQKVTWYY